MNLGLRSKCSEKRKEMRAMFDFAAENRDAADLKASALYDRTIRDIDFKVGDKVFNEVNAILNAKGVPRN